MKFLVTVIEMAFLAVMLQILVIRILKNKIKGWFFCVFKHKKDYANIIFIHDREKIKIILKNKGLLKYEYI